MNLNVLIVDDSSVMRKMVRRALDMAAVPIREVHEAGNGSDALSVLANQWIDVVFADIHMPVMNGVEMVEAMADKGMLVHTPVVIVSSDRSEERVERLGQLGVLAYLYKPFKPEQIRDVLREVLAREVPNAS